MFRRIILVFIIIFCFVSSASAFWIWTPQSKKWTNPKWSAKGTPKEQFEFAKSKLDIGETETALIEFKKVLTHFPESAEAAEAQFYTGECLEKLDKPYDAYTAYQKVISKYPFSTRLNEILKRQFKIAEKLTDMKYKVLGLPFTGDQYAVEVYRKVIDNAPYGELAALSQYRIGMIFKALARYDEAKDEFDKVVSAYPESEWSEAAKFQIAQCASLASLRSDYDQELTKEAKDKYSEFVARHPEAELTRDAEKQIQDLSNKEAEKDFNVAAFYEKQKEFKSAKIYYGYVVNQYPDSGWAKKASERIDALEKEGNL